MMAVWRRKPDGEVIVHSDQVSQYGSDDWQRFCRANNLAPSMSRRGNSRDNAVAESFFISLKNNGSENAYIKPGIWPGRISSITLKCSTNGPGVTATSAASVRRHLNSPRREDRKCLLLWGQSTTPLTCFKCSSHHFMAALNIFDILAISFAHSPECKHHYVHVYPQQLQR